MVTYEITAIVQTELCVPYERYMQDCHIPDLLATAAFVGASFARAAEGRYRIRYDARDRDALDMYLRDHAPRLRDHFAATFPSGIEVTREEWTVLETWSAGGQGGINAIGPLARRPCPPATLRADDVGHRPWLPSGRGRGSVEWGRGCRCPLR